VHDQFHIHGNFGLLNGTLLMSEPECMGLITFMFCEDLAVVCETFILHCKNL
jgi:hypothetical protein